MKPWNHFQTAKHQNNHTYDKEELQGWDEGEKNEEYAHATNQ